MKTRLLGAAVLVALAVLFVPMFFSSSPPAAGGDQTVSLEIPPAPDRDLQTKTMSLTPEGASPSATAPAIPANTTSVSVPAANPAASSDQLATVNIGSRRPRDVETDPAAGRAPEPTTVARPSASQPLIPAQAPATAAATKPAASAPASRPPAASAPADPGTAARGSYSLNLSAYASGASAQSLMQRVRALGYPVSSRPISQAGKSLTLVSAGPFETRAAAEAARLRITQTIPGAPARLESGASTVKGDAPARPAASAAAATGKPAARAGGYAVQVAAVGSQADANALRDKLRASGFDGFVDSVNAGGRQLWRVRAGPQTQRADAERVRDQIKAKLGIAGNVVGVP
ncbi:sporulation protein [Frateuria sp. Soil773]|uniref:SPOR domain-containing protein n=1 Tax=Frateuria sp. Soil773 TaxID=1736407 RepID=UPI000700C048|nr:SPOR domain-containing protein [Frateuria sp. Soil773]KRE89692.1 sporulation protein [Frateuria sp. Soil773]